MSRLAERALTQSFAVLPELILGSERGLESRPTLDQVEDLYDALNEQANQLDEWREAVIQLLLKPLVDEDEEAEITGDEFSDSTKFQENLMVFVSILRASIADRQDAISGQTNELIKHETQVARANALADVGPAPQTLLALSKLRDEHKPSAELGSLRSAVSELRQLCSRLNRDSGHGAHRGRLEALIAEKHIQGIQKQATEQNKVAIALESELEAFTAAMNARLEYYRQLQSVSDSVLPYEGPKEDADMNRLQASETELRRKLASSQAKHRYLLNIKEAGSKSNEPRLCIICQTTFMSGVLTVCGHQFCKECMMLWFKSHRNCPVCKRHLKASNLHDIVIKPQGLRVRADDVSGNALGAQKTTPSTSSTSKRTKIYSEFGEDKLAAIKDIELQGPSFTTKVDTLIRHLLWLRQADPGAKSIVYSS
jgi:E3 ubiquitin-protein ligase SHPRH